MLHNLQHFSFSILADLADHLQIFSANHALPRIFWTVVVVAVVVIAVIQLYQLLLYFIENPTLTSISIVYPDDGLQFPSLTICTLTKMNKTRLRERYPHISTTTAEFSTASFLSAYSTALMDFGYFYRKGLTFKKLQRDLNIDLGQHSLLDFVKVCVTC